jgi:hypothetical protein
MQSIGMWSVHGQKEAYDLKRSPQPVILPKASSPHILPESYALGIILNIPKLSEIHMSVDHWTFGSPQLSSASLRKALFQE